MRQENRRRRQESPSGGALDRRGTEWVELGFDRGATDRIADSRVQGALIPVGGGDPIPLNRTIMTVGRRESCDIWLRFPSVSGLHCELSYREGFWTIRDLGSTNGLKVNGNRELHRPLRPGDELAISGHRFTIRYDIDPEALRILESQLSEDEDFRSRSLLEKAGLAKPKRHPDNDEG